MECAQNEHKRKNIFANNYHELRQTGSCYIMLAKPNSDYAKALYKLTKGDLCARSYQGYT